MFSYSLMFLAFISFAAASYTVATPMDAGQSVVVAGQNPVLHTDVSVAQGGISDKDVGEVAVIVADNPCYLSSACTRADVPIVGKQTPNDWVVTSNSSSAIQPFVALLLIICVIVFFLSRKSVSTK